MLCRSDDKETLPLSLPRLVLWTRIMELKITHSPSLPPLHQIIRTIPIQYYNYKHSPLIHSFVHPLFVHLIGNIC